MDFTSSVENIDEVTRGIKISIPPEVISKELESTMKELTKTAVVKGFRPGKAPREMVEKLYGDRIKADVTERLISQSFSSLVKEKNIEMVGNPEFDVPALELGKELSYSAKVSVFPSPTVVGYDKLKVTVKKRTTQDKDVDEVIERVRGSKATMKKIELRNTAKKGDVVDLSVTVEVPGEKADRPEPFVVGLGEGKLPPEVESAIEGMEIAASKSIEVETPVSKKADAPTKKVTYKVVLNALFEKVLPEVNDEFVKSLGADAQTVLELRMKIRSEMEEDAATESRSEAQAAVIDQLTKSNEFKLPQILIDDEIRGLLVRFGAMDAQKAQSADLEPFRKELGEIAAKRVRGAIIIDRIGEAEKIKAEEKDINAELETLAARSGVSREEAQKFISDRTRFISFVMEVTRNKVVDFLLGKTEIEYVESTGAEEAKA